MSCAATGERFCAYGPWSRSNGKTTRTCGDCGDMVTYRPPKPHRPSLRELTHAVEEAEVELERAVERQRAKVAGQIPEIEVVEGVNPR